MVSSIFGSYGNQQKSSFEARVSDRAYVNGAGKGPDGVNKPGTAGWNADGVKKPGDARKNAQSADAANTGALKTKEWSPLSSNSPLVPTVKEGYGTVIGNVELSDKAKEYYNKLKSKFHSMDFILVGKAEKGRVAANASAYGNANKQVVLIDEEKLERMATDESFRKKYEGIIAMSQNKLAEMKNSLSSSGAAVKNFGISVDGDGRMSFFATLEQSREAQQKITEKHRAKAKAQHLKDKKIADKKANAERIEKLREKNHTAAAPKDDAADRPAEAPDAATAPLPEKEAEQPAGYLDLWADSIEDLARSVSVYAFEQIDAADARKEQSTLGASIDFRG